MSVEILDSDRVNFLVWRYLRESNYNEAALKLQKEWRRLDQIEGRDPANLSFAHHVKHHALRTRVHKGLGSQAYERELQQEDGEPVSNIGVFGPLTPVPLNNAAAPSSPVAAAGDDDTIIDDAGLEISRKRPHEWQNHQDQNESSSKRPRLSNGFEAENAMDLDGEHELDDEGQAYPSPAEVERPMTPIITRGPEEGTQVDKVMELTNSTAFYNLTSITEDSTASEAVLLHCAWNPQDPTILATAGTDALARLWTFERGTWTSSERERHETPLSPHVNGNAPHHPSPPFISLIKKTDDPSDFNVTAIAWTSDGKALALAIDPNIQNDNSTKLMIMSLAGGELQKCEGLEATITCLRWNPQSNILLALFYDEIEGSSSVSIFAPRIDGSFGRTEIFNTAKELVGSEGRRQTILDAVWVNETEFIICGEDLLRSFKLLDGQVIPKMLYTAHDYQGIVNMTYDARSQLIATGSEGGTVDVWDSKGERRSFSAHQGMVTALAWQSLDQPLASDESEVLLASAGEDAIISIWNVRGSETKARRCMTMDAAVLGLAFTPDGAFLAGATANQILIWKTDGMGLPRASWIPGNDQGWATPKSNGSYTVEQHHSLCWNASGQKLAYGAASQLAIIDFN